ncbi:unnamed protein product [Coregonus sp. 'balchen']|nr:unnamed protein product [Coregonus sp. 'balchen']
MVPHVVSETETFQDVVVEIERATRRKAFLGVYKHKATAAEYHHAAVQTMAKRKPHRVTVTSQSQQCTNSTSTQMTKIGCYVSNMEDKLISSCSYVTVITLQTYTRHWQAKRMKDQPRQDGELCLAWMEREGGERGSRLSTTGEWRREEVEHIDATLDGAEKKPAMCPLLV